jgi:hypothetical protein
MGLYSGLFIPIPTLILPLKGRKRIFDHGAKRLLIALLLRQSIIAFMLIPDYYRITPRVLTG